MLSYFTSESVTSGHPDKVCDEIADNILDEILKQDSCAHVACEVAMNANTVHIVGQVTAKAEVDYAAIARKIIADVGYTDKGLGFDSKTCNITVDIHEQSSDISRGIKKIEQLDSGAGDQGMMFGYACDETEHLMPFALEYSHKLARKLEEVRRSGALPYLRPDGKSQISVEYKDGNLNRITSVVVSTQHSDQVDIDRLREDIEEQVLCPVLPENMTDSQTNYFINPTGRFAIGGPAADTGLTGRKIIVDTYGGYARHGGGSFSGKDATKVDRSAAYMARYIAKNIVAAGITERCEVHLSYAIGLSEPLSFQIDDLGATKISMDKVRNYIIKNIDIRPMAIINKFGLRRPMFSKLSCYGHFGENAKDMPWEKCDLAEELRKLL
jgi:S-adenosylmethionine synthetase